MNTIHTNKYPGRCARCFAHVEADAGVLAFVTLRDAPAPTSMDFESLYLRRNVHTAGAVYCDSCAPHRETTAIPPDGHYAVTDSNGKLQFFVLARFPRNARRFATVSPSCKLVLGGKPDTPIVGLFATELVTRALKNPAGAALRYAQELGRCSRCNRHLTDEASRARGLGPECASR